MTGSRATASLTTGSLTKGRADPHPEPDSTGDDAERDADQDEERCGAGRLVHEETDDQTTDDGTDEEPAEPEQVTAAQPR
jgi:hypothetical protein